MSISSWTKRTVAALSLLSAAGLAAGCSSDEGAPNPAEISTASAGLCETTTDESAIFVATTLDFSKELNGITEGLDLDNKVSTSDDESTCQIKDFKDSNGAEGIDNQFSGLWKVVEEIVGDAVDGLLQGVINDGSLLLMFEVEGLDSRENDPCVTLDFFSGGGKPVLGTNNRIAPNQTFDLKENTPFSRALKGKVENGVLTAGPFDAVIPVQIFQVFFDLRIHNGYVRAKFNEDGGIDGLLAGGVEVQQILDVGKDAAGRDKNAGIINGTLPTLLWGRSDLDYREEDGNCHQISATLTFDGTPAFLFESTDALKTKYMEEKGGAASQ